MESVAYTSDHKETTSADASHHLTPTILEVKKQQISQVNEKPQKSLDDKAVFGKKSDDGIFTRGRERE